MTRIISYSDPQVSLLPVFPTLTLSPFLSPAAPFKMSPLVAVMCGARLIAGAVAMASTVGTDHGAQTGGGSLGPLALGKLFCWLVCVGLYVHSVCTDCTELGSCTSMHHRGIHGCSFLSFHDFDDVIKIGLTHDKQLLQSVMVMATYY